MLVKCQKRGNYIEMYVMAYGKSQAIQDSSRRWKELIRLAHSWLGIGIVWFGYFVLSSSHVTDLPH